MSWFDRFTPKLKWILTQEPTKYALKLQIAQHFILFALKLDRNEHLELGITAPVIIKLLQVNLYFTGFAYI